METGLELNRPVNKIVCIRKTYGQFYTFIIVVFIFMLVYCLKPPQIEHARNSALPDQETFDLDSTVQYHCHTGYVTNGFPRAKCLAIDGQASWYGPDIQCERRFINDSVSKTASFDQFVFIIRQQNHVVNLRIQLTAGIRVNVIPMVVKSHTIAAPDMSWWENMNAPVNRTDLGRQKSCQLASVSNYTSNILIMSAIHT